MYNIILAGIKDTLNSIVFIKTIIFTIIIYFSIMCLWSSAGVKFVYNTFVGQSRDGSGGGINICIGI